MISLFSSWARGIVIAVVVSTIIEMILPNGSSKKYVKSVIGIYILFVIISPVAKKITGKVDVNEILSNYEKKAEIAEENFERKNENNSNIKLEIHWMRNNCKLLKEDFILIFTILLKFFVILYTIFLHHHRLPNLNQQKTDLEYFQCFPICIQYVQ